MDLEKIKKIADKGKSLEKIGNLGLAKEFVNIEEAIVEVKDTLATLTNKMDEEIIYELEIT